MHFVLLIRCGQEDVNTAIHLTHWGRVTHISVSKLSIIGSDNGLSPGRRHAIIWTNAGILLIRTLGTNFSEILGEIHSFSFSKMHLKMSSVKWRLFGLGLNELTARFVVPSQYNVSTGRDRLRLTALTTNHHGGGAKMRICTFVVYGETRQRQHKWSRTDIVVHTVQLMWGIIWNLTTELLCIKAVKISAGSS